MLTHFLLLVAGFSLAAAAGWIVASSDGDAEAAPVAATPQEPPAPAPLPVATASEAPARTEAPAGDVAAAHPAAPPVEQTVAPPATPATPAIPPPRPAPAVVSPAPAARTAAARPKPTATPEVHAPTRQAGLLDACEPLGFIARERCKVDLCNNAANRRRAECAPVLAQQRLIQEKINPQLAN